MAISKVEINEGGTPRVLIDLTGDTVTADSLVVGHSAHGQDGEPVAGTNPYAKAETDSEVQTQAGLIEQIQTVLGGKTKHNELPAGYTRLDHIESNGEQCINTKFKPNSNSTVVMTVKFPTAPASNSGLFGSRTASTEQFWCYYRSSDKTFATRYGTSADIKIAATATDRNVVEMNRNTLVVNGITVTGASQTFTGQWELYLFAVNQSGEVQYPSSFRLYACEIYDDGLLIRNYIPCRNPYGEVGLYDTVTREFYGNVGTGAFVGGILAA